MFPAVTDQGTASLHGAVVGKDGCSIAAIWLDNSLVKVDEVSVVTIAVVLYPVRVMTDGTWRPLVNNVASVSLEAAVQPFVIQQLGAVMAPVAEGVGRLTFRHIVHSIVTLSQDRPKNRAVRPPGTAAADG